MGKRQNQKQLSIKFKDYNQKLDELARTDITNRVQQYKQFLDKCLFDCRISLKSHTIVKKYVSKLMGEEEEDEEIELQLKQTEKLYVKTKQIFKQGSLRQKYSNLLKGIIEQTKCEQKQQLSQQQLKQLQTIRTIYRKYKVSSMFRQNLVKQIKTKYLNTLINKGYLISRIISTDDIGESFQKFNVTKEVTKPLEIISLVS